MKKAILSALFVGLAVLVSCNKETPAPKSIDRFFSYRMTGNSMYTKSPAASDVLTLIESTLPESVQFVLQGNKTYNCNTGEPVNLPSGTYNVLSTFAPAEIATISTASNGGYLAAQPSFTIENPSLTITDEETSYTLPYKYTCYALVCDATLVDRATITDVWDKTKDIPFVISGDTMVIFATGKADTNYLRITIYPKDTDIYKVTEYTISTKVTTTLGYAEWGKYYLLNPTMNGAQPKLIGYELPTFQEGQLF
jgi:hypothetical protein